MHPDDKTLLWFLAVFTAMWCACQLVHRRDAACATDCLSKGFKPAECKELCE